MALVNIDQLANMEQLAYIENLVMGVGIAEDMIIMKNK